jgi:arylsulfatase A-like enzyme
MEKENLSSRTKAGAWAAVGGVLTAAMIMTTAPALTRSADAANAADKPNILVIMGDDIGTWNVSAYNQGMMGYRTPNIDRLAKEGALFTDFYGQQSCTAGRGAFITGQSGFRTGLLKIGMPGGKEGLSPKDPTLAELLKPLGYMTGQFGKNHLGDRNEFLPTVHGFDEFYGNLYHLNAEEEPENADYPKSAEFRKKFAPRGVIESYASDKDDPTEDGRNGRIGKQTIKDTGPLTKKRMETIDEEVTAKTLNFLERAKKADKPFFCWYNSTRIHIWTHLKKESDGKTGLGIIADAMTEHDGQVGQVLNKLKELGLEENTIVVYTTDNGAEVFSWPDGGTTTFRNEKNSNWEGGYRVPALVRWPGTIKPGTQINDITSLEDLMPTLMAAAGEPDIKAKLLAGHKAGDQTFKVHLDGYNLMPALQGKAEWPRHEFFYWSDGGSLVALRYDRWKIVFEEQRGHGFDVWQEPTVTLRMPKLFDLRADPFERADHESIGYSKWRVERAFAILPAVGYVSQHLSTYVDYPPRQKAGTFGLDQVLQKLQEGGEK